MTTKRDAIINGVLPRRGLVLVCESRDRIYGVIDRVERDGTVCWIGKLGGLVRSDPESLRRFGVTYEHGVFGRTHSCHPLPDCGELSPLSDEMEDAMRITE